MENSEKKCCCEETQVKSEGKPCGCLCGAEAINILDSLSDKCKDEAAELICNADEVFDMSHTHQLTPSARGLWNLHKEVIDVTISEGWTNKTHSWNQGLRSFWKYPLAFSTYAIPSLIMVEPGLYEEAVDCMKKTILLMRDTPVWDDFIRCEFADDPVSSKNIMYKGHLNLMYGLYQMVTGSTEFEEEFKAITKIIVTEYEKNSVCETPFWGVECEPDQYFPQCNSIGMMSMRIYDLVFGTDYNKRYSEHILGFIKEKLSDKSSGLMFAKYHPSHDQAEAYLTGFCNSWALGMLHYYDEEYYGKAFDVFKRDFVKEICGGRAAYVKEYANFDEPSTGLEESMGVFYATALAKEYNDKELWNKISRYFITTYGLELDGDTMRFRNASKEDETFVQNYIFWGEVHQGWSNIIHYDWEALRR